MPKDGEPDWLPEDTEAALAWQEEQDALCECGQPRSESMSPDGPDYAVTALRCRACEAREAAAARWAKDEHAILHGIKFAVTEEGG